MSKRLALPRLAVLATGGTIAAVKGVHRHYEAGGLSATSLLDSLPGITDKYAISVWQIANTGSQDINLDVWHRLHAAISDICRTDSADGIVITHGTDTLEETAYLLHLTVNSPIPIILAGAMFPPHGLVADGPANLHDALMVASASSVKGQGVLVVANGKIHSARYVSKTAASGIEAFQSRNMGPLGQVSDQGVELAASISKRHTVQSVFAGSLPDTLPRVPIVYGHADMDVECVSAILALEPPGLVVAGMGNGNVSSQVLDRLAKAAEEGIVVVRASRTGSGIVGRNVEINDDALGFVVAHDLGPAKARLLLQLALVTQLSVAKIQHCYYHY